MQQPRARRTFSQANKRTKSQSYDSVRAANVRVGGQSGTGVSPRHIGLSPISYEDKITGQLSRTNSQANYTQTRICLTP